MKTRICRSAKLAASAAPEVVVMTTRSTTKADKCQPHGISRLRGKRDFKKKNSYRYIMQPVKSEGFDSCDQPNNLIGSKSSIFQPVWWMTRSNIDSSSILCQALCIISKTADEFKLELKSGNAEFGSKLAIFFKTRQFPTNFILRVFLHYLFVRCNPNGNLSW